ncbi:hypothetical protein PG990_011921 [Apiospora arundinis]
MTSLRFMHTQQIPVWSRPPSFLPSWTNTCRLTHDNLPVALAQPYHCYSQPDKMDNTKTTTSSSSDNAAATCSQAPPVHPKADSNDQQAPQQNTGHDAHEHTGPTLPLKSHFKGMPKDWEKNKSM